VPSGLRMIYAASVVLHIRTTSVTPMPAQCRSRFHDETSANPDPRVMISPICPTKGRSGASGFIIQLRLCRCAPQGAMDFGQLARRCAADSVEKAIARAMMITVGCYIEKLVEGDSARSAAAFWRRSVIVRCRISNRMNMPNLIVAGCTRPEARKPMRRLSWRLHVISS